MSMWCKWHVIYQIYTQIRFTWNLFSNLEMSHHCELRNQLYHHLQGLTSKLPTLLNFLNGISRSVTEIGWQVPDTIHCMLTSGWQNWWLNLAIGAVLAKSSQGRCIIHSVVSLYYRLSIYRGYIWYDNAHSITITMIKLWLDLHSRTASHTSPLQASYGVSIVSYKKENYKNIESALWYGTLSPRCSQ